MAQRILYGATAILLLLGIFASDYLLSHKLAGISQLDRAPAATVLLGDLLYQGSIVPLVALAVALMAGHELSALLRRVDCKCDATASSTGIGILVLGPWFAAAGWFGQDAFGPVVEQIHLALLPLVLIGVAVPMLRRKELEGAIRDLTATWLVVVYCGFLASFLVLLRCDVDMPGWVGAAFVLFFLLICKSSDIGAYFVGSFIGRHKLIPNISPGKSVEGALGGVATSIAVSLLFWKLNHWAALGEDPGSVWMLADFARDGTFPLAQLSVTQVIVFGAVISIVAQLGDLLESLLKRSANIKDSGSVLPGFGGILDMVDSPFVAAPVAWILLTQVWQVI